MYAKKYLTDVRNGTGSFTDLEKNQLQDLRNEAKALMVASVPITVYNDLIVESGLTLIAPTISNQRSVVRRIKSGSHINVRHDGCWHIYHEESRLVFLDALIEQITAEELVIIRGYIIDIASEQIRERNPNDGLQITASEIFSRKWEIAYQKLLIPDQIEEGVRMIITMFDKFPKKREFVSALSHLKPHITKYLECFPSELSKLCELFKE